MKKVLTLLLLSSLAAPVLADECALVIEGNDAMQYNLKEMSVPATCKEVTVTLNHTGKLPVTAMGHNWVLASTAASGLRIDSSSSTSRRCGLVAVIGSFNGLGVHPAHNTDAGR